MSSPKEYGRHKSYLVIAGEASGDMHGAAFIRSLKEKHPECSIFGIGGEKMRLEGMELIYSIEKLAVLGIVEVIRHLPFIKKVFNTLIEESVKRNPTAVILIDYPDFNIRFARKIKNRFGRKITIMYYISPQVWAWRKSRIKTIAQFCDGMAVVFSFEEELYRGTGMKVRFVGHPLLDIVKPSLPENGFFERHGFDRKKPVIGLLPGSRLQETNRHLPVMLESMEKLSKNFEGIQVIIGSAPNLSESAYSNIDAPGAPKTIIADDVYNIMHYSTVVVVSSGTATLETAIAGTPMVIVYKMSTLTYLIARKLVSLPYIGMVNIVHGNKVVPELVQNDARPEKIYTEVTRLLTDKEHYSRTKESLEKTRSLLGTSGAAQRAVDLLFEILNEE